MSSNQWCPLGEPKGNVLLDEGERLVSHRQAKSYFSKRSQVSVTQGPPASMNNASGAAFAFNVGSKTIFIRSERLDKAVQTSLGEFLDEAG
jgi:hypothetical protein